MKDNSLTLQDLTKGNVWELTESDIFSLWAQCDEDIKENSRRYLDIVRTAFDVEKVIEFVPKKKDNREGEEGAEDIKKGAAEAKRRKALENAMLKKYEARGMQIGIIPIDSDDEKWAIKKRPINSVNDLTYDNINHISAAKLLEVIDRNFGGGWESLTQSTRDIIEKGFDVSTTTLPKDRLHKAGGLCELKLGDGYEMLEIPKGNWVEAIFAKAKPRMLTPQEVKKLEEEGDLDIDDEKDDESEAAETEDVKDEWNGSDDDDMLDDDTLTEESYRTTVEEDPDSLSLDVADLNEEDGDEEF